MRDQDRRSLVRRRVVGVQDEDGADFVQMYAVVAHPDAFVWVYRGNEIERDLWRGNAGYCVATIRTADGQMVGIACCHPLVSEAEPKIRKWVEEHQLPCPPEQCVIISCLMVVPEMRGHGLGLSLGFECLRWALEQEGRFTYFLLQTNAQMAERSTQFFRQIGAYQVARFQNGELDQNHIVLHYGNIREALADDECGEH